MIIRIGYNTTMKIITVPNPKLEQVSKAVELNQDIVKFVPKLEQTLLMKQNPAGVGLSAPQVAKNWRIFSLFLDHKQPGSIKTYVNPVVVGKSKELSLDETRSGPFLEGCLSIPFIYGPVKRHTWLELEYSYYDTATGQWKQEREKFADFPARVVQHELDHLEGILFTKRTLEQGMILYREVEGKLVPLPELNA